MSFALRRFGATYVVVLTLIVSLASAAETAPARPVAWLALRNYQRLDQRLHEIATLAKAPGMADMLLGMVQLQLAGLGGLDRQRPISVVVPTVSLSDRPPIAVVLPYTERDAILQTVRGIFPQTIIENGEQLSLQGGPIPAFGRLDTQANVLIVSSSPEAANGVDVTLPANLFGEKDEGADLVLRVDADAVKQQLDAAWKGMLAGMEQFWQAAFQKAAEDQAMSEADKMAMIAYGTMIQKGFRQFLEDLVLGESRLTLAPTGWVFDLEAKMRSGSGTAAFLNAQAAHTSRVGQLFSSATDAFMRLVYNVRMTDALRQEMVGMFPMLRQMFEKKLAALPALTPEQRTAGTQALASYFTLIEQWYARKEIEAAVEVQLRETGIAISGWFPFVESARSLDIILDIVEKIPILAGDMVAKVTRDIGKHLGTAVHRIDVSTAQATPEIPHTAFVAAQGEFLTLYLGNAPEPLYGLLNRIRTLSPQASTQTDALIHMEIFLAPVLKLSMSKGQTGSKDPVGQALIDKLQHGPNEPFLIDLLTRQDAATLRYTLPGALVQSIAEVMGQQITQQLRGGGGGEKKSNGGKPTK